MLRVYRHVTGRQFAHLMLGLSPDQAWATARAHWLGLLAEYTPVVPALALAGLITTRHSALRSVTASGFVLSAAWAYLATPPDRLVFALPAELMLVLWASMGVGAAASWAERRWQISARRWALVVPALVVMLALRLVAINYEVVDASEDWETYNLALGTLEAMPRGAILLTNLCVSHNGAYPYLQVIEGRRRDVTVVHVSLVRKHFGAANVADPVIRRALEYAYRGSPVAGTGPEMRDVRSFWSLLLEALMPARRERRVFAQLPAAQRPAGYVWKDYGIFSEVLTGWPRLETAARLTSPEAGAVSLAGVEVRPSAVRAGQLLWITIRWHVSQRVEQVIPLMLGFRPIRSKEGAAGAGFGAAYRFVYGKAPLEPNRPGYVYVQELPFLMPVQARPGMYEIMISMSPDGVPRELGLLVQVWK